MILLLYKQKVQVLEPPVHLLHKSRFCLTYEGQYFEIDLYPFWDDQAIVEIELSDENAEVNFPPELKVLREVTRDPAFRNSALAKLA